MIIDGLKTLVQCRSANSGRTIVRTPSDHTLSNDGAVEVTIATSTGVRHKIDADTAVLGYNKTGTISDDAAGLTAERCAALLSGLTPMIDGTEVAFGARVGSTRVLNDKSVFV